MAKFLDENTRSQLNSNFENTIGQNRIKEILGRAVKRNILPHAYLFLGMDGVGKDAVAIELARMLLCLSDQASKAGETKTVPCGLCPSCAQSKNLTHPDLRILYPLPKPKDSKEASSRETYSNAQQKQIDELLASKSKDYYTPLEVSGGQEILIEHIRSLRQEFRLTSFSGGWRIVLLSHAERLRVQAANAFLKLLEEPPDNVMFILTSSRESKILPTILSRCQVLRFSPLEESELSSALEDRLKINADRASVSARLASGSWRAAKQWAQEDPSAEMNKAVNILRLLVAGDPGELDSLADKWGAASNVDNFKSLLVLLSKWLRDVQKYDADPENFNELKNDTALIKFSSFVEGRDLATAIKAVDLARSDLEKRVQPALVAHGLFVTIRNVLFEKHR